MEMFTQAKQYLMPAAISVMAVGLMKVGIFVTHGDMEQSLRTLENSIRGEYATRQDIEDIKFLLNRMNMQLDRLDDRLDKLRKEDRHAE